MPDYQYEMRCRNEAIRGEREVNAQRLSDRQEARKEFIEALKDPASLAGDVADLLGGNYGYGEMMLAKQILGMSKRANKVAGLSQLVAVYRWRCPRVFAIDAWKKLTKPEQENVRRAIQMVIDEAEKAGLNE